MATPDRHLLRDIWGGFADHVRILVTKAPRDATDLWIVVCVLALAVLAIYVSALARGF